MQGYAVSIGQRSALDPTGVLTVYVVLLMALPAQLVVGPLGAVGTPAVLWGLFCGAWWLSEKALPLGSPTGFQPIRYALLVLIVTVLPSYVVAATRIAEPLEVRSGDRYLIALLAGTGVALLAADGIRSRAALDVLLRRVSLAGAVIAGLGILQFATGFDVARLYDGIPLLTQNDGLAGIAERSLFRRIAATTSHPIEFGVVLCIILPISLHFAFTEGMRHRFRNWIPVVVIGVAIPMAVSRSAVLGLTVALVVLAPGWSRRQLWRALIALPVFIVAMRVAIPGLLGTIRSLFTYAAYDPSITTRTDDYVIVREYFWEHPWIGRGYGTFIPELYLFIDNQYLGQVVETGIVGLGGLILVFLVGFGTARGARMRAMDFPTRGLGQALAASIAVPAVTFVTFDGFAFRMVTGLTFLSLGCAGALWRLTGGMSPGGSSRWMRPVRSGLVVVPGSPAGTKRDP